MNERALSGNEAHASKVEELAERLLRVGQLLGGRGDEAEEDKVRAVWVDDDPPHSNLICQKTYKKRVREQLVCAGLTRVCRCWSR